MTIVGMLVMGVGIGAGHLYFKAKLDAQHKKFEERTNKIIKEINKR